MRLAEHTINRDSGRYWITCDGETIAEKQFDAPSIEETQMWARQVVDEHRPVCPFPPRQDDEAPAKRGV